MNVKRNKCLQVFIVSIIIFSVFPAAADAIKSYVTEEIFDHTVFDPYRWMENGDDNRLGGWIKEQRATADQYLAGELKDQILSELRSAALSSEGVKSLSQKLEMEFNQQRHYHMRRSPYISDLDLTLDAVSASGRYRATYSVNNGGDLKILQIYDNHQNYFLRDAIQVKFADVYWSSNDEYLIYSTDRDHRNGGTTMVLAAHKIGESSNQNDKILWEAQHSVQWASILRVGINDYLMVSDDKTNERALYTVDIDTQTVGEKIWHSNDTLSLVSVDDTHLYFISYQHHSNGEVIRLDSRTMQQEKFLPVYDLPLESVSFWRGHIFAHYLKNDVTHQVMEFDAESKKMHAVKLPFSGIFRFRENEYVYGGSYSVPWLYLTYNEKERSLELTASAKKGMENATIDAQPIFYTLPTGEESVVWVMTKKGVVVDAHTPLYLYGYGGFQINILPNNNFPVRYKPILERGGAVAVVTLPGGMEQGADWHKLGNLLNKNNVFAAMAAAARTLQEKKISSSHHMAIGGGSNGGLLVAATINQYPRLFQAAVPEVGVLDSLRYHLHTGGKWWVSEYGNPEIETDFNYIKSYSPYHNIKSQPYPSVMVMTGDGDDRVVPAHSYKYAAKLQSVLSGDEDNTSTVVLLHTAKFASHGGSTLAEERIEALANKLTFLLKEIM